jgi:DnaJ-class molecular chaperone
MKVTFVEEIEDHIAFSSKKFCPKCGYHGYTIHHQLEPETSSAWWVSCPECEAEGLPGPSKDVAMGRWRQL